MTTDWTMDELQASVEAYLKMLKQWRSGERFVKSEVYRELAKRFGRTEDAFARRMQNISYVMSLLGREWLPGLSPARNVGANVGAKIEQLIANAEGRKIAPAVAMEVEVREQFNKVLRKPDGSAHPPAVVAEVSAFRRDAAVKAWVLRRAKGTCEGCCKPAPFSDSSGMPYLEVHHVRQLADGGSDRISNAVALCPNCHRQMHHGGDNKTLREGLYALVSELTREGA